MSLLTSREKRSSIKRKALSGEETQQENMKDAIEGTSSNVV